MNLRDVAAPLLAVLVAVPGTAAAQSFVNWESPHVHPIDVTPDGTRVLAVNTADDRLEVFVVVGASLEHVGSVPVGLDPVTVRVRDDGEAWVVNHVSDSISVVDLGAMNVRATVRTGDEPADVVFAGGGERAFVSISQLNEVHVYDPSDLDAAPVVLSIDGEDPRALATDGTRVYAAILESGNDTTIIGEDVVSSSANPYGGNPNPPPNAGGSFDPPIGRDLPAPPATSLILKKDAGGAWRDDNGADWSLAITWDLHDHDVAVIDADALSVTYVTGVMNANMALAAKESGDVVVVGTDCTNEIRFEPNIAGTFVRVLGASFSGAAASPAALVDLNPHLDYSTPSVPQPTRDLSLGDPRGIAWNGTGDRLYVSGMGSDNLLVLDATLNRVARIEVGSGPTGVAVHPTSGRVYVVNKFEGSVSVVDPAAATEVARLAFFDPTPALVRTGRTHLYDTHRTSGLGQASCASCHLDARMDQVAWDLGDPQGEVKPQDQSCNLGLGGCADWHPMKGPMTTQTLIGIDGTEPLHWRGDRGDLDQFNPAFVSLLGDDVELTEPEMAEFTAFITSLTTMPNPNRNLDGTLPTSMPNGGNAQTGEDLFVNAPLDFVTCATCHALPTGTNGGLTSAMLIQESQDMKVPQLRNMHEKTGFSTASGSNNRGFGFIHDGSVPTLFEFLQFDGFNFNDDQEREDVVAFLMCFSTDTHAGIGAQVTIDAPGAAAIAFRDQLVAIADGGAVGLVAKGVYGGEARGFVYTGGGQLQSDRASETVSLASLDAASGAGSELTYTIVPLGSETRIGIDRDQDGAFDRDELDVCANPADTKSFPGGPGDTGCCTGDVTGDGTVGFQDLTTLLGTWGPCPGCVADLDGDGGVGFSDLSTLLGMWGSCGS